MTGKNIIENDICKMALETYGAQMQTLMVFEEMSELQKELIKDARGCSNNNAIAEEIADVEIMLEQMKILHNCKDKVDAIRTQKIGRLLDRMITQKQERV